MRIGKLCMILCLALLLLMIFGDEGLIDYFSYRSNLAALKSTNSSLEAEAEHLQKEMCLLTEPHHIETVARHELGMVREGDTVYRFMDRRRKTPINGSNSPVTARDATTSPSRSTNETGTE